MLLLLRWPAGTRSDWELPMLLLGGSRRGWESLMLFLGGSRWDWVLPMLLLLDWFNPIFNFNFSFEFSFLTGVFFLFRPSKKLLTLTFDEPVVFLIVFTGFVGVSSHPSVELSEKFVFTRRFFLVASCTAIASSLEKSSASFSFLFASSKVAKHTFLYKILTY